MLCSDYNLLLDQHFTVWGKGNNNFGQLGLGNTESSNYYVQMPTDHKIISIACGKFHSVLLTSSKFVLGCGNNDSIQLGTFKIKNALSPVQFEDLSLVTMISCGVSSTSCLTVDGDVYQYGFKARGTKIDLPNPIIHIAKRNASDLLLKIL